MNELTDHLESVGKERPVLKIKYYIQKNCLLSRWVDLPERKPSVVYRIHMNGIGLDKLLIREWVLNAISFTDLSLDSIEQVDGKLVKRPTFIIALKNLKSDYGLPSNLISLIALKPEVSSVSWSSEKLHEIA